MKLILAALLIAGSSPLLAQKSFQLLSPDNQLKADVSVDKNVTVALNSGTTEVLAASPISMTLQSGEVLGGNSPKVSKVTRAEGNHVVASPFYKRSSVRDQYNELSIAFKGNYKIVFRLYNEGMAYRFETARKGDMIVKNEQASYRFSSDHHAIVPYVNSTAATFDEQFRNSFEQTYVDTAITQLNSKRLLILPAIVALDNGKKVCITEVNLENYPGMFLNNSTDKPELKGVFATYPKKVEQGGHNNLQGIVTEREDFIAKTVGIRSFPWRVFVVSNEDKDLANSDMVYRLADPCRVKDLSWIKPGKVAWDWWNDWNIYGVDFHAGVNNDTYKYYIDFASKHGIEYVILDEGWAVNKQADLMQVVPEINLEELTSYAKSKNVGLVLWAGYKAFDRDMENVVKHYSEMGIKGFKVDFMDRDDQEISEFLYRAAATCAKYKVMLDFHGIHKPTGLQRTYPNVINYEGVAGLEQLKWAPDEYNMVEFDATIPFARMVAGPMDYTQGAMRNAAKGNFRAINSEPMSQGTRCHQLALYTVLESPFNMLCDNPSNYSRELECTRFISAIPTTWEETVVLNGEVTQYVSIARRHGIDWYIGSLTNWTPRDLVLDLSFLGSGEYKMEVFKDGVNADRAGNDYKREVINVPASKKLTIHLAPGGGFAAHIYK